MTKRLHSLDDSSTFTQSVSYLYNERGWLQKSSAALFEEQLQYDKSEVSGITPIAQYNGNIASQSWGKSATPNTGSYTYTYDNLNRLTDGTSTDNNNEKGITYDMMGNITALKRYQGGSLVDDLSYNYLLGTDNTNQLQKISDNSSSDFGLQHGTNWAYNYDVNGNMKSDASKGITQINYNLLNLPQTYAVSGGTITYTYDAEGNKLSRSNTQGTGYTTYYVDGIQYDDTNLSSIQTEEGRAVNVAGTYNYQYTLTDHLGNSRVNFDINAGATRPLQADNYYPFGMDIAVGTIPSNKNPYLYNKKELQDGLGLYDFGARGYDAVLGRWNVMDPMAEKYYSISSYVYCANNPIRYVDPTGMIIEDPDELVKTQKAQLNQNLSNIKNALKSEGLSEEMTDALNNLAGAFQSSLTEISTLEKSDQVYSVHYSEGKEGGVQYNNKTGAIDIGIGKSDASIGLIGHELKHAYQYEKQQVSILTDNSGYGKLYDITDETAAYNRDRTFGAGILFFQTPNSVENGYPLQMNDNNVRSFGNSMTPPAYQTLPNGPIDINSREGKALRQQTMEAGRAGTSVKEVYKGWQRDYLKGQKN